MRRWSIPGFLVAALLVGLAGGYAGAVIGYGSKNEKPVAGETAYERVLRTGTVRCGYAISPPRMIKDPNTKQISGLDYDTWQSVGSQLGLKIEWTEEAGWGNFIEGLRTGRYDAFCSAMFPDAARSKFLSLTQPIMYSIEKAYVRADDHRFDGDLEKINGPEISLPVIDGDVSAFAFKERFPKARMLSLPQTATVSDMFMAVTSGKADVILLDSPMFDALNANNPGKLRVLENVPPALIFANVYGFAPEELKLRDIVNVALRTLIDNGALEKLTKKYPGEYLFARKNYEVGT
ncbi:MAG: transporter substrate-binding domain-containing protein [Alphaproteobacteria bacterium]|nr:transporter substrate-binding domain-containing protein [Alphaproteobacteria bacterium]